MSLEDAEPPFLVYLYFETVVDLWVLKVVKFIFKTPFWFRPTGISVYGTKSLLGPLSQDITEMEVQSSAVAPLGIGTEK